DPAFADGPVDTGFLERGRAALVAPPPPAPEGAVALAALAIVLGADTGGDVAGDPWSPWASRSGWRLRGGGEQPLRLRDGRHDRDVRLRFVRGGLEVILSAGTIRASGRLEGGRLDADLDGVRVRATVSLGDGEAVVVLGGRTHRLAVVDPAAGE